MKIYIRSDADDEAFVKKMESLSDAEWNALTEDEREEYHAAQSRLHSERESRRMTDDDYKRASKEMWDSDEFTMLDVDAQKISTDPHSFALDVINALYDNFSPLYNDTWYAVMLGDPRAKMIVSTNRANTLRLVNFKGVEIEITRKSVKQARIFQSEFDRYKFLSIAFEREVKLYRD